MEARNGKKNVMESKYGSWRNLNKSNALRNES